jgi:hypothetical protein
MAAMLVVFVSSRGALATLAGVPSVERHVQAGRTLGFGVTVVYPPERRALGAEIRGLVDADVACIPADQLADHIAKETGVAPDRRREIDTGESSSAGSARHAACVQDRNLPGEVFVVAAEWYLSMAALLAVRDARARRVFGRTCERGFVSVPVARVDVDDALAVAAQLGTTSAAAALAAMLGPGIASVDLDSRGEQRLSDNVSTAHAEEKLIENLFGPQRVLPLLRLRPTLAPLLARRFNQTELGPAGISAIKLVLGLAAAWILGGSSYAAGLAGAVLYFVARLVGASGIVLARASLSDNDVRERLDLAGDTVLHLALLWALAGGAARDSGGVMLAAVATVGVLVSTGIAYTFVLRENREARRRSLEVPGSIHVATAAAGDEFVSRFVQRDGIAYALLFAAVAGRLDLLLWAAALASHLFYVLWLITRPRREDGTMAIGRPA